MNRVLTALALAAALVVPSLASAQASLKNPASLTEKAPATYKVKFDTSAGVFVIQVTREWAPLGADRFYNLVKNGWYDDTRFFRAIKGFMVQFGINGDPALNATWRNARIGVDAVKQGNKPMYISFAMGATPDTRTTQVFINYKENNQLADPRYNFTVFGKVVSGMDVVDRFVRVGDPSGGLDQERLWNDGEAYLASLSVKPTMIEEAVVE